MWSPLSAKPAAGFTKIIIGFSIMIMAVLLFLTSWVYRFYGEEMEKQIYSANREQLRQTSVMVEFLSEYAQSVLMSVKMNPSIYYLGSNSGVQDLRLREALNQLDTIRLTSPEVYSIYIYNVKQQVIYTSGSNEQTMIHDADSFYDQEFIELAASLDDTQPYYTPYSHSIPVWNPNNENYTLDIYTYLYFDRYYSGKVNNVVAVNFSSSWINKSIGYFNNPTEMSNYINIVDNKGNLVFSQNPEEVTPEEEQEYIQKVLNSSDKDGYFLQEINGEMKLISYVVPETWGYDTWRFVSIADYHSVFINQISAQRILTIVSAAAIFFVLALIFIMSHRLRRPVQQLFSKIEAFEKQDKLHFRHNRIHFLSQLLTGHYAKETVNEDLERYHLSFDPQKSLRVIAIQKKKTSDQLSGNEWKELFEKEWKAYSTRFETFSSSEENLFIITESDDSREHLQYLKELLEDIQAELYKHTENFQLCITISSCGHTYRDLPFLYREALKLQSCFFTLGYQHIVTEEDNQNEAAGFVYPIDIEKNLLHNAFRGREEIALQYHPTKVGVMHPGLSFDLFGEMLSALKSRGIRTVAYVPIGWEEEAAKNINWVEIDQRGVIGGKSPLENGYYQWRKLCLNKRGYIAYIKSYIDELLANYEFDGFWFDIVRQYGCICDDCRKGMRQMGLSPENPGDVRKYGLYVTEQFQKEITQYVKEKKDRMSLYYNGGWKLDDAFSMLSARGIFSRL